MLCLSHMAPSPSSNLSADERRFWLLAAECERLLTEEAFAIKKRDIDYLESIIERKEIIVSAMTALESILDRKRPDAMDAEARIRTLQSSNADNLAKIDVLLKDLQLDKQDIVREKSRGKALNQAYYGSLRASGHQFDKQG